MDVVVIRRLGKIEVMQKEMEAMELKHCWWSLDASGVSCMFSLLKGIFNPVL